MNSTLRSPRPIRARAAALAAAALLLAPTGATRAAQSSTTFSVTSGFVASCAVSASALEFGAGVPSPIASPIDATATVVATCSTALPFTVELGPGTGGTLLNRQMVGPAGTLRYQTYVDAARSQLWGDGSQGTSVASTVGTGAAQPIPVYGRILAGQAPPPGAYADQIVVTVRF